jgi:3',5'-cyclic AMP phosphodiesterase CpdA
MLTILHISDLHFGPPYYPDVGDAVQRLAAELEPDVIVASGDFTQRAKEEQFRAAAEFLALLPPAPLIVTPGNHDVPMYRVMERLLDPYRYYQQYILPELDTVTEVPGAVIVAINSTAPRLALTNGRIHRWQIDFAREAFTGLPDETLKILVSHHHFAPPPDWEGAEVMPKAKRALDAFTAMGVDMILGGHLHRAYIGNSLDVYSGPSRDHGIVIIQSGTTTSRRGRAREREKNSLNVLRVDGKLIRVTHHMYFQAAQAFVPSSRHIFYRGGHPPMPGDGEERSVLGAHNEYEDLPVRR